MSIRSIDLLVMYSKTQDVEKLHQGQQQSPQVVQQQLAAEETQRRDMKRAQVQEAPKDGEDGKVERKKDNEGGGRGTYGQNLKQMKEQLEREEEKKKLQAEQSKPASIDIRI